jgi:hypothetical protein
VALVLAVAVGVVLLTYAAAAAYAIDSRHVTLGAESVAFLTTSTGAIIGVLGAYLGFTKADRTGDGPGRHPTPDSADRPDDGSGEAA